ncbi:hypothetical protein I4U23_009334 [Adineta vaga]|nr:hypothetical protein I4U23_009334 [Adineta vaga]
MNPFEILISETSENGMSRSQSFDLSKSVSSMPQQQHIQISSAIGCDPSRLANFLGYREPINNKSSQKLETIYENLPSSNQTMSSNFQWNQNRDQQLSDNRITSVRGSVSSWNL